MQMFLTKATSLKGVEWWYNSNCIGANRLAKRAERVVYEFVSRLLAQLDSSAESI